MMKQSGVVTTHTILDKIMAHKHTEIRLAKARVAQAELESQLSALPPALNMAQTLRQDHVTLIAEVKKASPSKGVFLEDFSPIAIAQDYAEHGASAISVLTDKQFFQGHLEYLRQVKATVHLPVLRKEFVLDGYQIVEARAAGADAVLLIAACLEDGLMADLHAQIESLGMTALVEVHNEAEIERVLKLNPALIGINNRDLHTFTVDLATTVRLAALCPDHITLVGESGINTVADVEKLAKAGAHAILVGEALILAPNRAAKIRELSGVKR